MQRSDTIGQFHQDRGSWTFQRATTIISVDVGVDTMLRIVKTSKFLSSQVKNCCMTITTVIANIAGIIGSIIEILLMNIVLL